jgi:hypothetical protein
MIVGSTLWAFQYHNIALDTVDTKVDCGPSFLTKDLPKSQEDLG